MTTKRRYSIKTIERDVYFYFAGNIHRNPIKARRQRLFYEAFIDKRKAEKDMRVKDVFYIIYTKQIQILKAMYK